MDLIPLSRAELQGLPSIYPTLFDVCHFILAAIAVRSIFKAPFRSRIFPEILINIFALVVSYHLIRKEFGVPFTRTHPLAAWLAHLSASFAGPVPPPTADPVTKVSDFKWGRLYLNNFSPLFDNCCGNLNAHHHLCCTFPPPDGEKLLFHLQVPWSATLSLANRYLY